MCIRDSVHAEEVVVVHRIFVLRALRAHVGAADGAEQQTLRWHDAWFGHTAPGRFTGQTARGFLIRAASGWEGQGDTPASYGDARNGPRSTGVLPRRAPAPPAWA